MTIDTATLEGIAEGDISLGYDLASPLLYSFAVSLACTMPLLIGWRCFMEHLPGRFPAIGIAIAQVSLASPRHRHRHQDRHRRHRRRRRTATLALLHSILVHAHLPS